MREKKEKKKDQSCFVAAGLACCFLPKDKEKHLTFHPCNADKRRGSREGVADEVMWHNSNDASDTRIAASSQWNAGCLVRLRHPQWTFVSGLFVLLQQQRRSTTPFLSSITLFHKAEPFKQWNGISKWSYIKVSGFFETHKTMKGLVG